MLVPVLAVLAACGGSADSAPPSIEDLVEILGADHRPFEPRLGGFGYAPCEPSTDLEDPLPEPTCRPLPASGPRRERLDRLTARIHREAEDRPAPRSLHLAGVADLLAGRLDRGVERLAAAAEQAPRNARISSDLAAAHLVKAASDDRAQHLLAALIAADRAVALDGGLAAAAFNRALALRRLFLAGDERKAWREYLRADPDSGWAAEARSALAAETAAGGELWEPRRRVLEAAILAGDAPAADGIVDRFRQESRRHVETELLSRWARAAAEGRVEEEARALRLARSIADSLARAGGDPLLRDALAELDRPGAPAPESRHAASIDGHRSYAAGLQTLRDSRPADARDHFDRARRQLLAAGSPFWAWAAIQSAICSYHGQELDRALADLGEVLADPALESYPALRGRARWIEALALLSQGRPAASLPTYRQALEAFERAGEPGNAAAVKHLLAENLDLLGAYPQAWSYRYEALRRLTDVPDRRLLHSVLHESSFALMRQGQPAIALYFQNRLVADAREWQSPEALSQALLWRARTRLQSSSAVPREERQPSAEDAARRDLEAAAEEADRVADPLLRAKIQASVSLVGGEVAVRESPAAAIEPLESARAYFGAAGHHPHLALIHVLLGRARFAVGDIAGAELELAAAIGELERTRGQLRDPQLHASLSEQGRALFDEMIRFQLAERARPEIALEVAESARRALLAQVADDPGGSLSAAEIRSRLPADTVLLEYGLLADRLLIWVVRADGLELREIERGSAGVEELVDRALTALEQRDPSPAAGASLEALYRLLIAPVAGELGAGSTLVVVPDRALHRVPFAALRDPATGRYLIEDREVAVAPSAALYLRSLARDRELRGRGGVTRPLVVGATEFDAVLFPQLYRLPAAAVEAETVAGLYPRAELLAAAEATPAALLAALAGADALHFAGHAVADPDAPLRSKLVLAPGNGNPGVLTAAELLGERLDHLRWVVLSGCSTGASFLSETEGVAALARPFLAAGVPAVVVSLWEVDDRATAELFARFHRGLSAGRDPAAALRAAQLELLAETSPSEWAAFQLVGPGLTSR